MDRELKKDGSSEIAAYKYISSASRNARCILGHPKQSRETFPQKNGKNKPRVFVTEGLRNMAWTLSFMNFLRIGCDGFGTAKSNPKDLGGV